MTANGKHEKRVAVAFYIISLGSQRLCEGGILFLLLIREHGSSDRPSDSPKATGLGWKPDLLMPSTSLQDSALALSLQFTA